MCTSILLCEQRFSGASPAWKPDASSKIIQADRPGASGVGANASSNPFSRTLRLVLGNQISIPLCMIEASEVPVWKLHATERDVFYPSPFSLTVLIDGSNPGYIILFCTTSQVYSLECMQNGRAHLTVSEEEKEEP